MSCEQSAEQVSTEKIGRIIGYFCCEKEQPVVLNL